MEKEVLIACNVGDLSWLKASLAESEKTVNEIVNNEVTPLSLRPALELHSNAGSHSITLGCLPEEHTSTQIPPRRLQRGRHQLLNGSHS